MSSPPPEPALLQSAVAAVEGQDDHPAGNSHNGSGPDQQDESQTQDNEEQHAQLNNEHPQTFEDFWATLLEDILLYSSGRSGFQIIILLLFIMTHLGLFIATTVKSADDRLLFVYHLNRFALSLVLLGYAAHTHHHLLERGKKNLLLAVSHILHVAPQLINVAVLVRQAITTEEGHSKTSLFLAAADDLSGSVPIKVFLVPALANGIGALGAGAAGTPWRWTERSMEPVPHYESLQLVFSAVLFSGGYVFLRSQPRSQSPPQITSAFNTTASHSGSFWSIIGLALCHLVAVLLSIVVKHSDYVNDYSRWKSPPDDTTNGTELQTLQQTLDGTDEHDEDSNDTSIAVWLGRWRQIPFDFRRFIRTTFLTPLRRYFWSSVSWFNRSFNEYWTYRWETLAILIQTVVLGLVSWMTAWFAHSCVLDAEKETVSTTFGGVRLLGIFIFPALEILAFLPTYRDAWHGEAAQVIRESYLSATYTLSMNTAVIFLAAANADQITFIEIDSFHIVLVIAAIAVSVLYTNFATVTRLTRLILALSTVVVFGAVLVLAHSQDSLSAQPHEPPTTTTSVSGHAAPTMFVQKPGAYRATEF